MSTLQPAGRFPAPAGLDSCAALLVYEGAARALVVSLKYRNGRAVLGRIALAMAATLCETEPELDSAPRSHLELVPPFSLHTVTWAPTSSIRRRRRGYDQAELLARSLARHLTLPCVALLRRQPGPAQTGRARAERLSGPLFEAVAPAPRRVLIVDDVITTGATMTAAAHVLRSAGATEIDGIATARTDNTTPRDNLG